MLAFLRHNRRKLGGKKVAKFLRFPLWFFLHFPSTISRVNKTRLSLIPFLALPLLFSCGGQEEVSPTLLDLGTMVGTTSRSSASESVPLTKIPYSELAYLLQSKGSFVLLVRGSDDLCQCWHDFAAILTPYIKAKHLLVYSIDLATYEAEPTRPVLPLVKGYDTIAVFGDGEVKASICSNDSSGFGTKATVFNAWMNKRILTPKVYLIDQDQLDNLYEGVSPTGEATSRFALLFGRLTCPDCSYMSEHDLRDYFKARQGSYEKLYYFDADVWRGKPDYQDKKDEYGLSLTEDNPYGYDKGVVPTLLSVIPSGGEKIATIDQIGVFYNDTITDGVITQTYFTNERLEDEITGLKGACSYLENLADPVLLGKSVDTTKKKNEALSPLTKPLVNALLDAIL